MSEKTEKATPYKLQKAKEQGMVSKSVELTSCFFLCVMLGVFVSLGPVNTQTFQILLKRLLIISTKISFTLDTLTQLQQNILTNLLYFWAPFAFAGILTIILATIAQTGVVFSTKPLCPDFKRLNPIQGLKRLFSIRIFFEALKNIIKMILIFVLVGFTLKRATVEIFANMHTETEHYNALMWTLLARLLFHMIILLFFVAILDKYYTRWKYGKDQRMSKQEVKDEHRKREGDPLIKSKLRQLQHQLRKKNASISEIKTADVIITNPTHIAIALRYQQGVMPAPKVVCKARGEQVILVKKLAHRYNIPIVENIAFAWALFNAVELNQWITVELFPIAASIFQSIYANKEKA